MILSTIKKQPPRDQKKPRGGSLAKKFGIGMFLFFLIKGLVWLVVLGVAAVGVTKVI